MRDRALRMWKMLVRERANREWRELSIEVLDELACHLADLHAAAIQRGASDDDARQLAIDALNTASFLELSKRPRARRGTEFGIRSSTYPTFVSGTDAWRRPAETHCDDRRLPP